MAVVMMKGLGTPEEILREALDKANDIDVVIVIALNKDGTQSYSRSTGSQMQVCFLKDFFVSHVLNWWKGGDHG